MMNKRIYVFADWETFSQPELVGVLSSDVVRGKENFRFSYDNEWLSSPYVQQIDPNLYLYLESNTVQIHKIFISF